MSRNNVKLSAAEKLKRSPRVNMVQKKLLVKLIENYFIRKMGHYSNVNLEIIEVTAWDEFAKLLNKRGPPKTPVQWKNCFYYMKNRIRKSVDLIRQCDASLSTNLSDLDFKIYSMSSEGYFGVSADMTVDSESNNFNFNADDGAANGNDSDDDVNPVADRNVFGNTDLDFVGCENSFEEPIVGVSQDQQNTEFVDESHRVYVAETPEQLEEYMNTSIVVSDEEEIFCGENEENITETEERPDVVFLSNADQLSETTHVNAAQQPKTTDRVKIPEIQKERLVQLVQNNFLKAFGRFSGKNGKHIKTQLWRDIAHELNTLGPHRTGEQWKTTFETIKASAKAKLADNHNNIDSTVRKTLTRLEEKVLSIYGIDVLDGSQGLGEAGFRYEKTVPAGRRANNKPDTQELPTSEVNRVTQNSESLTENGFDDNTIPAGRRANNKPDAQELPTSEVNLVTQNSESLTENGCDDNTSMRRSLDEDAILQEILREIREEDNSACNRTSRVINDTSAHHTPRESESNIVDTGLRARGSVNRANRSEMENSECSLSMNDSSFANNTLTGVPVVSQNHTNDESGKRILGTAHHSSTQDIAYDASRLHVSSLSAHGRFSTITNIQLSLQGSQNRVRGGPRLRGLSTSARERFSPITNVQPSLQGSQKHFRGGPRLRGLSSSARGRFSPITNVQPSLQGSQNHVRCGPRLRGLSSSARGRVSPITNVQPSLQGSHNRVRGVPRLRGRGSSSSARGQFSEITSIQQFFDDNGNDDDEDALGDDEDVLGNPSRANGSNVAAVDKPARDRTNLRHRYTSYEMVSRSIDAQEEFIEQDMRKIRKSCMLLSEIIQK